MSPPSLNINLQHCDMESSKGKGTSSIIIVDHDNIFVQLIKAMLQQHDWKVSGFTCPAAAMQAFEGGEIQPCLLIAGLDMPDSPMQKLIDRTRRQHPELPCLIIATDRKVLPMILPENTQFTHKPIRPSQLLLIVEEMLQPLQSA